MARLHLWLRQQTSVQMSDTSSVLSGLSSMGRMHITSPWIPLRVWRAAKPLNQVKGIAPIRINLTAHMPLREKELTIHDSLKPLLLVLGVDNVQKKLVVGSCHYLQLSETWSLKIVRLLHLGMLSAI